MKRLILAFFAIASFAACSDGLEDTKVKDLTSEQAKEWCEDIRGEITLSKEDACEFAAVFAASFGGDCEMSKQECINSEESLNATPTCENGELPDSSKSCELTVGEYEDCIVAQSESLKSISCSSKLDELLKIPPACEAVKAKCPELLQLNEPK